MAESSCPKCGKTGFEVLESTSLNALINTLRDAVKVSENAGRLSVSVDEREYHRGRGEAYRQMLSAVEEARERWGPDVAARFTWRFEDAALYYLERYENAASEEEENNCYGWFQAYQQAALLITSLFSLAEVKEE
ncbi:MAG: hypothetical protein AB1510_02560 [Bacillota bacterium]